MKLTKNEKYLIKNGVITQYIAAINHIDGLSEKHFNKELHEILRSTKKGMKHEKELSYEPKKIQKDANWYNSSIK